MGAYRPYYSEVTFSAALRKNVAVVAFLSLLLSLLTFTSQLAFATPLGTLTINDSGSDSLPAPSSGVYDIQSNITVKPADIETALGSGNVTLWATSIVVQSDIDGPNTNSLTLKASANITVAPGVGITNQGGDVIFWADSDSSSDGYILLGTLTSASQCVVDSNGGDIVLGGRSNPLTDFASGGTSAPVATQPIFGVGIWGCSLDAGGGNISIRGSTGASNSSVRAVFLGTQNQAPNNRTTISTSGSGSVLIYGDASQSATGTNPWGPTGTADITTASGDVSIIGKTDNASGANRRGMVFSAFTITSTSGNVLIQDQTPGTNSSNAGLYFGGGASSITTSGSITVEADKYLSDATLSVSTGPFSVIPYSGSSFSNNPSLGNVNASNASSVTFGAAGNTANVTVNNSLSVNGPLTIHGGNVAISAATTATTVNLFSSGATTQSQPITATNLALNGSGSFALTNTSNNFGTIAGGASGSELGSVSVYDASGNLTIGTVGSLQGISASGDILIETGSGDITLANDLTTSSTSAAAITVNAGKSTAIETSSGGDIKLSGSPTVTTGAAGIVRLFSGSETASTGLSSLVGSANVRYRVDEENVNQFSLSSGSKYALYRAKLFSSAVLESIFVGGTEIESGKSLPVFVNGTTSTAVTPVRGCFEYSVNGVTPTPRVGAGSWAGSSARPFTSSSGSLEEYFYVFWTNRNPATEVYDSNTPDADRCAALAANFEPDIRSNTVTIFPVGTLTPSASTVSASVGSAISTVTMVPSASRPSGTVSYSVSPSLPAGLTLNSSTGAISGTPTTETASATYTVTATISATVTTALPSTTASRTVWDATTDVVLSVGKEIPSLSSLSNRVVTVGAAPVSLTAPTATNQSSGSVAGSITWSSGNASVASISGSTLTYGSVGTAVVTATFTPSDTSTYQSATTTFTVTVSSAGGGGGSSSTSSSRVVSSPPPAPTISPRQTRLTIVGPNTDPVPRPVERLGLVFDPNAPSRATVGGAPANLVKTPVGSKYLSIAAGAFQFGVSLADADGAEVQTDTPSQSPELFVPRGQSAAVSGKGSYPGSFVQLFLPGNGDDSRELARIPVGSDGTFSSDLSFQAGALELPVPIGRQVLQVVGYDELGNQTVVDMTVNIGQGVPAPEPNREAGALPALTAGQSLATSGGIPETVSVTGVPEAGNVVVEGAGWVINVNADRDNGVVETTEGNVFVRLNPSSVGTTSGSGFLPGTLATVWLFSEPTLVATVSVNDAGEFSAEFLVDARLIPPGEHTLQVQGVGSDGYIKAANLGVLVEEPVELTTESASNMLLWVVGVFLLALVLPLFVLARRRRREA